MTDHVNRHFTIRDLMYDAKCKGNQIRARAEWVEKGEKIINTFLAWKEVGNLVMLLITLREMMV